MFKAFQLHSGRGYTTNQAIIMMLWTMQVSELGQQSLHTNLEAPISRIAVLYQEQHWEGYGLDRRRVCQTG